MANAEQVKILKQGMEKWNEWREKNLEIKVDLRFANLFEADLSGADFRVVGITSANLTGVDLNGAEITGADLRGAKLIRGFFIEANLSEANLGSANLKFAEMRFTNLISANLSLADLRWANLSEANLGSASLIEADLRGAYLSGADLRGADLTMANLSEADLIGADLSGARIGFTIFGNVDLSETKGLEETRHSYPSTIGIDTIYKSKGKIPDVFLRKAGVPENLITHIQSLMGKAVDYYACFISFTEKDDMFSERLYNDLLAKGVRCWRWKEDAKWGKTLMKSIDEAVRAYDKLVVICSEQSLQAPAVIREIERALQKEDELARQGQNDEVLFPIRLDDYIFTNWQHHRKADVTSKNVGDFRNWTDPDAYSKCLNRLLRDLKSESSTS